MATEYILLVHVLGKNPTRSYITNVVDSIESGIQFESVLIVRYKYLQEQKYIDT